MKNWKLDSRQCVSVDCHRNVYFKHYFGKRRKGITLSWRQFLNLNDIIMDLKTLQNIKYYPLGGNIWLQYYKNCIQLYHCHLSIYFSFHEASWNKYKKEIHHHILSFLRHGSTTLYSRKYTPKYETLFQSPSRNITSTTSKQQVLSGTTTNVGGENEQWAKSSNLSEWDSTNSRRPFSFIGAVHALGTTENATSDMEEGEVYDVAMDSEQSSDLCSIE